jgi:hypothetical protein
MDLPTGAGASTEDSARQDEGLPSAVQPGREQLSARAARFARRHACFAVLLLAATAVRAIVMLGYPGPLLYPDSAPYVWTAVHLSPDQLNPSGYPMMLWLVSHVHGVLDINALTLVVIIQHAMGLCVGLLGYALLRRKGLPGWAATLAMVPVLLSAYAMQIEHFVLSDTLFGFLVMVAVVVMMWWPEPPLWAYAVAGVLLAVAAVVRAQGVAVLIIFLAFLLIRFTRWRTLASLAVFCVAFALPTAEYAAWFDSWHGTYAITTSNGEFLYAEVTTFANCAIIHPPANERKMCLNVPVADRNTYAAYYLWTWKANPLRNVQGGNAANAANSAGLDFGLRAIRAQPLAYLRAVGQNFEESFLLHGGYHFELGMFVGHPHAYTVAWAGAQSEMDYMFPARAPLWPLKYDLGFFDSYDGSPPNESIVHPYSGWIQTYQRYVVLSGPLLGVIALIGLVGVVLGWRRRGGDALLPWLVGIGLLLAPAAILFDVRFIICAVAPLCVAAAIGAQQVVTRLR